MYYRIILKLKAMLKETRYKSKEHVDMMMKKINVTSALTKEDFEDPLDNAIHNYDQGRIETIREIITYLENLEANGEPYEDENAETLEDKLRDEHRPIPEEREDASLFETMAEKFKPQP